MIEAVSCLARHFRKSQFKAKAEASQMQPQLSDPKEILTWHKSASGRKVNGCEHNIGRYTLRIPR